jgi:hypothetical protein
VKFSCRISGLVSFAAFLCFLPCASGQSVANVKVTGSGRFLNVEPSNVLALALTKGDDFYKNFNKNGNTCDGRKGQSDKCAAVPEGGASLMYLLLAGLFCLGGFVLRSRWQMSLRHTD